MALVVQLIHDFTPPPHPCIGSYSRFMINDYISQYLRGTRAGTYSLGIGINQNVLNEKNPLVLLVNVFVLIL